MSLARRNVNHGSRARRRGFTLIEILVSIAIIALLIGLTLVGVRAARSSARANADRAGITALKNAVSQFKQTFGFLPPLVRDDGVPVPPGPPLPPGANAPLAANQTAILVYNQSDPGQLAFLCGRDSAGQTWAAGTVDYRYSYHSLAFYLVGALGVIPGSTNTAPIDGVDGPGMLTPKRDGTFEKAGRRFEPFFDITKSPKILVNQDPADGEIVLMDPYGTPYRYYRWVRGYFAAGKYVDQLIDPANPTQSNLNIPAGVLSGANPSKLSVADRLKELTEARDADYAIVAAGPNRVFGDEPLAELAAKLSVGVPTPGSPEEDSLRDRARVDNIVEFGR